MIQTHLLLVVFRMCFLICFVVFVFLVLTRASDLSVDMFLGSTNLMDGMEDLPPGIGQYDDFHTIDWLRDISRDRMRHRHIVKRRQEGCFEKLKAAHDAWSGWVCVLLVGCAAGLFCIHTHTHPFNGPLSGTTRVSRYQKGKTDLDFTEARDSEWQ